MNDYVVEGTPECPWRDEKTIIRIKAYLFKEPPEGPRRDEKKTIIRIKAYLLEEHPEGPRRDEKNNCGLEIR